MSTQFDSDKEEYEDLAQVMLREDLRLKHDPSGRLRKGKWYTPIVKKLFFKDINLFVMSREIYKAVIANDSEYAFIYRRPDLVKIKATYRIGII
jgi:hypothetical protein